MELLITKKSRIHNRTGKIIYSAVRSSAYLFASVCGCLYLFNSSAKAVVELSGYEALAADVEVSGENSSNISYNSAEQDDFIYQVFPRLRYRFDEGAIRVEAYAGVDFVRYDDYNEYDSEDIKSRIKLEYPYVENSSDRRFDVLVEAGYNENTSPNSGVQAITETEEINFHLAGRYYISEIFYLRAGPEYLDRQSVTSGYDDVTEFAIPIEFFYQYSEQLSFGLGYRYAEVDVGDQTPGDGVEADSIDHSIYLSTIGKVLPSVTAALRIGAQSREYENDIYDDETGFYMESLFQWEASEQTKVELSVGSAFDTTIANESREVFFAGVEVRHSFNEQIRSEASLGYEDADYTQSVDGRKDESFSFALGATYVLIEERLELGGRIAYSDRESTRLVSDYDVLSAKLSINYLF